MPAKLTKYEIHPSEKDRICVSFKVDRGRVISFTVQYQTQVEREWRSILRFDTAHGHAHKDIYGYSKKRKLRSVTIPGSDYGLILTESLKQITNKWSKMKENFMHQ